MAVLKRAAALALVAAAAGCMREPTALDLSGTPLGVYSILRAGSDSAAVLVVRYRENVQVFEPAFSPVAGAEVVLTGPEGTIQLQGGGGTCLAAARPGDYPLDPAPGCYAAAVPGGIRAGERYELRVRVPGGEEVRGQAVVPGAPSFVTPAPNTRIARGADGGFAFPLAWQAPASAALVTLSVRAEEGGCEVAPEQEDVQPGQAFPVGSPGRDSALVRLRGAGCIRDGIPVAVDSVPARLLLAAYDSVYSRYVEEVASERGAVLSSRASAGLEGAVGIFAGVATTERRIVFLPRPAQ